jgi:hypothetical protein
MALISKLLTNQELDDIDLSSACLFSFSLRNFSSLCCSFSSAVTIKWLVGTGYWKKGGKKKGLPLDFWSFCALVLKNKN